MFAFAAGEFPSTLMTYESSDNVSPNDSTGSLTYCFYIRRVITPVMSGGNELSIATLPTLSFCKKLDITQK